MPTLETKLYGEMPVAPILSPFANALVAAGLADVRNGVIEVHWSELLQPPTNIHHRESMTEKIPVSTVEKNESAVSDIMARLMERAAEMVEERCIRNGHFNGEVRRDVVREGEYLYANVVVIDYGLPHYTIERT